MGQPPSVATREQQLAPIPRVDWRLSDSPSPSAGYTMASVGSQAVLFTSKEGMYLWDGTAWTPQEAEGWPAFRAISPRPP